MFLPEASFDGILQRLGDALVDAARANATLDQQWCLRREAGDVAVAMEADAEEADGRSAAVRTHGRLRLLRAPVLLRAHVGAPTTG
ncbi:hypothetical protein P43SY_000624 [Pythium insidiosum]|uniref:Uncharacterized protein n=1 Tax=Pythium insidiosum TaxID=114742 RepID=A0AAD5Q1N6_PYTIN|nr:hypothetical protein P43SY_000624 [Pythium insidiosum]KAJ0393685.1 hypothetical protein ATCC90586_000786 [Pythium insidiosum]